MASNSEILTMIEQSESLANDKSDDSWKKSLRNNLLEIKEQILSLQRRETALRETQSTLKNEIQSLHQQIEQYPQPSKASQSRECVKCTQSEPTKRSVHRQNQIPDSILNDKDLQSAISSLPSNYNFEIFKSIWRLQSASPRCKRVALQFPEGLLMYSCIIADILERFADVETMILGDVTYGACCIDDFTSSALECDFLIHYGHSCLIPIHEMNPEYYQRILYVFVQIAINPLHLATTIAFNFNPLNGFKSKKMVIAGTIQFVSILPNIAHRLCTDHGFEEQQLILPQAKPLSPAEVLGCTSPDLKAKYGEDIDCILFVSDGRFHLESIMIANPQIEDKDGFFRYNPYDNRITKEGYDTELMHQIRKKAISKAKSVYDRRWVVVLSSLGRQGSVAVLDRLEGMMAQKGIECVTVLLSEIYGSKLEQFELKEIGCFVQIGCPRLSIDWGPELLKEHEIPILNAYEATVALEEMEWQRVYPMDNYRSNGGIWSNYYMTEDERKRKEAERKERRRQLRKQRLLQKANGKKKRVAGVYG